MSFKIIRERQQKNKRQKQVGEVVIHLSGLCELLK
jgi:hypothetical protein